MRSWLAATLLAFIVAGCVGPEPSAPRTQALSVTFTNEPAPETGDLLAESVEVAYVVANAKGTFWLAPDASRTVAVDVSAMEEFPLEHRATSGTGTASGATHTYGRDTCEGFATVAVDVRYHAKLTAGAWTWGFEADHSCVA